jgi:hypothetical protein
VELTWAQPSSETQAREEVGAKRRRPEEEYIRDEQLVSNKKNITQTTAHSLRNTVCLSGACLAVGAYRVFR